MKLLRAIICFILCLAIICSFVGCGDSESSAIVYFELNQKPDTLDAQLASTEQELLLVRNIYEGLLRENQKGEIVCAAAESFSKDGLVYTFKLRKDAAWSTGEKLTAHDFVFAFRRAVDPEIKAPFVKRLFSIKNAESVYSGGASPESLGVTALDDHTLKITLCREDADFEKTLTTSVAMPCNEDFFKSCKGQYGIKAQYIISNGSYSITKWNREDFGIRIYRNSSYNGNFKALNGAVFFSLEEDSTPAERLRDNKVDIAFIENSDISNFKGNDFKTLSFENICWFLSFGNEYNDNLRKAFALLSDSSVYKDKLAVGFRVSDSIYPKILGSLDNTVGVGLSGYDADSAFSLFSSEIMHFEDKKLPSTTLTYYDNPSIKPVVTAIVGHWQQTLSAFVNISPYAENEHLIPQLTTHTLPMSVFCVRLTSGYMDEYLENFGVDYDGKDLADIQADILKANYIIPIAFENTNIVYSEDLSGVSSSTLGGYIDFSFVEKND